MTPFVNVLKTYWPLIAWVLLNIINAFSKMPTDQSSKRSVAWHFFLDRICLPILAKKDSATYMKMPFAASRRRVDKATPPAPPISAAVVLPLLLALFVSGCAFGKAMGACELSKLPQSEQAVLVSIVDIANQPTDYESALESLGVKVGVDAFKCLIQAILATPRAAKWTPPISPVASARLRAYLEKHSAPAGK
jgi:hypothetical protein